MSYCREEGKDKIIFVTKEDHDIPSLSTVKLVEEGDDEPGLILPNGDINWNCPCLGGMATGPCGVDFREAFSCFHYSKAEAKGSDCYEQFKQMQECMVQYPEVYPRSKDTDDDDDIDNDLDDLNLGSLDILRDENDDDTNKSDDIDDDIIKDKIDEIKNDEMKESDDNNRTDKSDKNVENIQNNDSLKPVAEIS